MCTIHFNSCLCSGLSSIITEGLFNATFSLCDHILLLAEEKNRMVQFSVYRYQIEDIKCLSILLSERPIICLNYVNLYQIDHLLLYFGSLYQTNPMTWSDELTHAVAYKYKHTWHAYVHCLRLAKHTQKVSLFSDGETNNHNKKKTIYFTPYFFFS